jgi:hypothetical protein
MNPAATCSIPTHTSDVVNTYGETSSVGNRTSRSHRKIVCRDAAAVTARLG